MLRKSLLVLGCAFVASLMLVSGSLGLSDHERLFSIEGRKLATKHDVATQLRNFLPNKLKPKERCERYALALAEFEKKDSLNYFKMAEIATMDKKRAGAEFKRILWLQLMDLYKTGVESFQAAHKVNTAMVELYECLKIDFGAQDAKSIRFLNNKELQKIIHQWNLIAKESAELLTGQKQHPTLRFEDLHGDVKNTVARWLVGGERDLPRLFASVYQRQQPQAKAVAKVAVGDSKRPEPVVRVEPPVQARNAPEVGPKFQPKHEPRFQSQPEIQIQPPLEPKSPPKPEPEIRKPEFPMKPEIQFQSEPHPGVQLQSPEQAEQLPQENELQWSEDEANLLNEKVEELLKTYNSLSLDTPLAKTCQVYNKVISGIDQPEETSEKNQSDEVFVPGQSERANFLFMLRMVLMAHNAEGLFLDLAYCAEKWKSVDDEIREYFNSAEYFEALESIKPPEEPVESESVNQPVAA